MDAVREIRRIVMADASLCAALTSVQTDAELYAMVIALGRERGLEITDQMLQEAARGNYRDFLERWLPK